MEPGGHRWRSYLDAFHRDEAGVTEEILVRARDRAGRDPYERVAAAVGTGVRVVDLACGSAPLAARVAGVDYLGVDRSAEELALARARSPSARLLQADADQLTEVVGGSVDVVACSMALQVLEPLGPVLAAVAAVLRPGGRLVASVPSTGALTTADRMRWLGVVVALRSRPRFPNDAQMSRLPDLLARAGLDVVADDHVRYSLPLRDRADAERLVASLYLPGIPASRRRGAAAVLTRTGRGLGLSLRHLTAVRHA